MFGDPASPTVVCGSIDSSMIFQLIVLLLSLQHRGNVMKHFLDGESLSSKKTSWSVSPLPCLEHLKCHSLLDHF
jgi:hypothetical protein